MQIDYMTWHQKDVKTKSKVQNGEGQIRKRYGPYNRKEIKHMKMEEWRSLQIRKRCILNRVFETSY